MSYDYLSQYSAHQNVLAQQQQQKQMQARGLGNIYQAFQSFCVTCGEAGIHTHSSEEIKQEEKKETKTMYDAIKTWFNKHSDLLVTLAAFFVADHFVFGGKFRHKLEQMVEGLIDKAAKKVESHQA